jgi:excinuclease ABC subunit A
LAIDQVLNLTLQEASQLFEHHKSIVSKLKPAIDLGLGYLKLGQPSSSLSGGEAQRLKLAPYLSRRDNSGTVLLLDEPTLGLHFEDVAKLVAALKGIVRAGATVIAIEHNAAFMKDADYVITIGPKAGVEGGKLLSANFTH